MKKGCKIAVSYTHLVILLLAIRRTGNGHRGILDRYQASSPVGMASGHGERPVRQIAIETQDVYKRQGLHITRIGL